MEPLPLVAASPAVVLGRPEARKAASDALMLPPSPTLARPLRREGGAGSAGRGAEGSARTGRRTDGQTDGRRTDGPGALLGNSGYFTQAGA